MQRKTLVRSHVYHDSVVLMAISQRAAAVPGVQNAIAVMGTAMNKEFLANVGLLNPAVEVAGADDLIIGIEAESESALAAALQAIDHGLQERAAAQPAGQRTQPARTLASALREMAEANLAVVSVPGEFAAREARQALAAGLHVFLYSDNVPLEDEVELKQSAAARGLLCMGPDCGSALIGGVGLGFANAVRPGAVGIVAASGTGLQEVACLVHRLGAGVSHAIGTGGRDLSRQVGGMTMRQGIRLLAGDPATRCMVLISKPPDPEVARQVLDEAKRAGKPVIACFLGSDGQGYDLGRVARAGTLQEAAELAVSALAGARAGLTPEGEFVRQVQRLASAPGRGHVRGLFSGGTLCQEAALELTRHLGPVYSNIASDPALRLAGGEASRGHALWDLGDDHFTVGRPHPMIEPALRLPHLEREAADPAAAVILLDLVLGHGAHPDPAGALAPAIRAALERADSRETSLAVVASVTGTDDDPQRLLAQVATLKEAGAVVAPSAAWAARAAAAIAARRPELVQGEGN